MKKFILIFVMIFLVSCPAYGFVINTGASGGGTQTPWTSNIDGGGYNLTNTGTIAGDLLLDTINSPTYTNIQDWSNTTQSAGILSGFTMTDSGSGQIDIAAGTGIVKTTSSELGANVFFDYAGTTNFALVDNDTNYIYINYNAGTPVAASTLTRSDISHWDEVGIGRVYRSGTTVEILSSGVQINDLGYRSHKKSSQTEGFRRVSGFTTTETGDLSLAITAGVMWFGNSTASLGAIDTSGVGTFSYWYNNGTWQSSDVSVINATQYNNYGTGLADLTNNNHYGCHFIYETFAGNPNVVYGIGTYSTLADAMGAPTPANLPDKINDFAIYLGKIIVQKTETSSFTDVRYPWSDITTTGMTGDHGSLSGLSDDDHPQYGQLVDAETITGNWINTANPWVDNEVTNDLTLDLFKMTVLTSAPGTPSAGRWYYADNSTWDPADIAGIDNYYCIYDGAAYIAIMDEDGTMFVSSIETPTLKASELNDVSDPHLLIAPELKNKVITNSESIGADEWDFPARTEGWNFIFIIESAQNVVLDPNGTEQWYLNGSQLAAGENIVNAAPTIGECIACFSTESSVYCESKYSDWKEETP